MMRSPAVRCGAFLLLALVVVLGATGPALARSPAFDAVMTRVYEQYARPNDLTLQELEQNIPTHLAIMIGLVLQGQMDHVAGNAALREPFVQLQHEFRDYLGQVAQRAGNVERFTGKPIDRDALWGIVFDAIRGKYDQFAVQEYGRAPGPGPSVFAAGRPPGPGPTGSGPERAPAGRTATPPAQDRGKLLHPADDHINLLGVRAEGVERTPSDPPPSTDPPPER